MSAEEAETLTLRFRWFGYNAKRLHHIDNTWGLTRDSADRTTLNPMALAALDQAVATFLRHVLMLTLLDEFA